MTHTVRQRAQQYIRERTLQGIFTGTTPRTVDSVLWGFCRTVGTDREPNSLARSDIERWLERDVAASTKRNQYSVVRAWLRWMVEHDYIRRDPTVGVRSPRQPRMIPHRVSDDEVGDLVRAAPDSRAELIIFLMSETGLRCLEVANLQLGDIDFFGKVIRVTGKGGHQRELPLCANTQIALRQYLAEYPATSGPLVRSYANPRRALSAGYISGRIAKWMRDAGMRPDRVGVARGQFPSAHWMRHGAAQAAIENGADPRTVQTFLGHDSLNTTSRYTGRASMEQMREALAKREYRRPKSQQEAG